MFDLILAYLEVTVLERDPVVGTVLRMHMPIQWTQV